MKASWLSPDTTVFNTIEAIKTEAAASGYSWVAIDGTGTVYAGARKPERHQSYNLWIWLHDNEPKITLTPRLGWYDLDGKDWRDCRYEV